VKFGVPDQPRTAAASAAPFVRADGCHAIAAESGRGGLCVHEFHTSFKREDSEQCVVADGITAEGKR